MAVIPGVEYKPVVSGAYPRILRHDIVCIHTIVGYAPAPAAHFSTKANGHIIQNRDTLYQSAANYKGNYRVLAIENEDFGPAFGPWSGSNVPPFTDQQIESIAQICAWANKIHKIPLWLCPNSRPISTGIAYHRQGIEGNFGSFDFGGRITGGETWSLARGKVCPGDRRIHQIIDKIIPRARVIAGLDKPPTPPVEDDMFSDADRELLKSLTKTTTASLNISSDILVRISQLMSLCDLRLSSLLSRPLPVDVRNELLDLQKDVTNTMYAINNQSSWNELPSWGELSDKAWGRLVNLTS